MEEESEGQFREKLDLCVKVLLVGTSPSAHKVECDGRPGKAEGLRVVWDKLVKECEGMLELNQSSREMFDLANADASWRLSVILLNALVELRNCVTFLESLPQVRQAPAELLSLQALHAIQKALDVIFGLGVVSNLPSGIGMKSHGVNLQVVNVGTLSDYEKYVGTEYIIHELGSLCTHPVIAQRILGNSLRHFLAASIFLCYTSIRNPEQNPKSPLSMEEYTVVAGRQECLRRQFENDVMPLAKKSDVVKYIFLFSNEATPKWYRNKCKEMVMDIFLSRHGMMIVATGLSDLFTGNAVEQIALVLKNLITDFVKANSMNTGDLCFEAQEMICVENEIWKNKNEDFWIQLGVYCALVLMELDPASCREHIWDIVFKPLFDVKDLILSTNTLTCKDVEFCTRIAEIILAYRGTTGLQGHIVLFKPVWNTLFKIFTCIGKYLNQRVKILDVTKRMEPLWEKLQNLFCTYLAITHCNGQPRLIDLCVEILISRGRKDEPIPLRFNIDCSNDNENPEFQKSEDDSESIFDIISEDSKILFESVLNGPKRSKFVLSSLLFQLVSFKSDNSDKTKKKDDNLIGPDQLADQLDEKDLQKFVTLSLLSEFETGEILEECVNVEGGKDSIAYTVLIFKRLIQELEETEGRHGEIYEFVGSLDYTLHVTLAMAESLVNPNGNDPKPDFSWSDLGPFKPLLKSIMDSKYPGIVGAPVQEFAENVYIKIMTRGQGSKTNNVTELGTPYERCMTDISSPLPFIKGHGLLDLKKCIENKCPETIGNIDKILPILIAELKNDDSYVYLLSISALSALGTNKHSTVIPILLQEYMSGMKGGNEAERVESRLKVAQSITSILKCIGEVAQSYLIPVTNTCFTVLRDQDPLIRASSLSMLAELSALLKFSLAMVLTEIWRAVEGLLKTEKDLVVRRASIFLVAESLKGLRNTVTNDYVISGPDIATHLRDVRRKLQFLRQTESDPTCLLHVQQCLEEMSDIATKLLTPATKLEKHIRVLR